MNPPVAQHSARFQQSSAWVRQLKQECWSGVPSVYKEQLALFCTWGTDDISVAARSASNGWVPLWMRKGLAQSRWVGGDWVWWSNDTGDIQIIRPDSHPSSKRGSTYQLIATTFLAMTSPSHGAHDTPPSRRSHAGEQFPSSAPFR